MTTPGSHELELLAKLAGGSGSDAWSQFEARRPEHDPKPQGKDDPQLDGLLDRINSIAAAEDPSSIVAEAAPESVEDETPGLSEFVPLEPESFRAAELTDSEVEALILKFLLSRGDATGHTIAEHLCLPFRLVDELLRAMKYDQLVVHKSAAEMNDYVYQMTDIGRERGRRVAEHCTYFGSAPVSLRDYVAAVREQSLEGQQSSVEDLKRAFSDLLINQDMLRRLGPAINSGRGLFLFGAPGNGKTSIAERVTRAFGPTIWIPRAIGFDGEVMRLFDPNHHQEMPLPPGSGLLQDTRVDRRWVRIRRPTIVVGGELTMSNLEVTLNSSTGISEAPVQLKSNCGTLVIDDFGRQRMSTDELLNRWIVPLEKRYDFLNLPSGKKIQVPFDQFVIFSTNLEPKDLVDDAFLRRIPYKIEVPDPSENEFRQLMRLMCDKLGIDHCEETIDYLVDAHYRAVKRPFRCCQPRDLLMQVRNFCRYQGEPIELTRDNIDFAVDTYFAAMEGDKRW